MTSILQQSVSLQTRLASRRELDTSLWKGKARLLSKRPEGRPVLSKTNEIHLEVGGFAVGSSLVRYMMVFKLGLCASTSASGFWTGSGLAASQKGCWGVLARPNLACGLTFTEIQNLRPKMV